MDEFQLGMMRAQHNINMDFLWMMQRIKATDPKVEKFCLQQAAEARRRFALELDPDFKREREIEAEYERMVSPPPAAKET